jgi:hypothetical protein
MSKKELTKQQIAIISGTVGGAILIGGLIAILLITQKNSAPPAQTSVVKPPIQAGSSMVVVKSEVCAPVSSNFQGLVPCEKQATCTGCMEYADASNPYSCITVSGGNNQLLENGQLATPMPVTYSVPENGVSCRGHGTYDATKEVCKCDKGYSGKQCEVYTLNITQPGSFCLPSYANKCMSPTTDSVLMNANSGKGGQFTCACKPEYRGMFAQSVAGGTCDVTLACGGSSPQMDAAQTTPIKYAVFKKFDDKGDPVFSSKAVYVNRLTSFNTGATETCYAKTKKDTTSEPYDTYLLASDADPTCKPQLESNYCKALSSASDYSTSVIVRGSNAPGDPLRKRVSPAYFPPVPPALQKCPNGYTGKNTPSSPCMKDGKQLFLMPAKVTPCGDPEIDVYTDDFVFEGTGQWYGSAFTDDGEWNAAFGCVKDLTSAQMKLGADGTPVPVRSSLWHTVDKNFVMEEVDCLDRYDPWLTRASINPDTNQYAFSEGCVGTSCNAARGSRRKAWDGYRDGALLDNTGSPWFESDAGATFGGQCTCDGVGYRDRKGVPVKSMPEYINRYAGKESWWSCGADTCSTASNPNAYLDTTEMSEGGTSVTYPRCMCNHGDGSKTYPISTQISYAAQNSMPTCIADPCNPHGAKTTAEVQCTTDAMCGGICYGTKCHYPRTGQTCIDDDGCTSVSNAKVKGKCVPRTMIDPSFTGDAKECIYEDEERSEAGTSCKLNRDCSYGKCVAFSNVGGEFVGTCSGGCACDKETVQQFRSDSPLGFACLEKCQINPCVNGDCVIDPETGQQKCICRPCYTGELCEISGNGSRKNEFCDTTQEDKNKDGYWLCCEEGSECKNNKCT